MQISIAMATYNGATFLKEQLDSFLSQTRLPDELVVCDDGSTDSTRDILAAFKRKAPFSVRIFPNEKNLGYAKNFEKALSLCEGDIIFLSDQDDVWFANKLEVMEQVFAQNPRAMVAINDQVITDGKLEPTPFTKLGNIRKAGLPESWFISGCCTSLRTEWLRFVLPFPSDVRSHDRWIGELANALEVRLIHPIPLQFYRRHGNNATESAVSSTRTLSRLGYHRTHGLADLREAWKKNILEDKQYVNRLQEISTGLVNESFQAAANRARARYEKHIGSFEQRIAITSKPRCQRLPDVVQLYLQGGYQSFAGWRSALKDIVRPRGPI